MRCLLALLRLVRVRARAVVVLGAVQTVHFHEKYFVLLGHVGLCAAGRVRRHREARALCAKVVGDKVETEVRKSFKRDLV